MSKKTYLGIEKKIFLNLGKISYIIIFTLIGVLIMSGINFILYCFVDNYSFSKFLFSKEITFSQWWSLSSKTYLYPYPRMIFFAIIFFALGIFRSRKLEKEFN